MNREWKSKEAYDTGVPFVQKETEGGTSGKSIQKERLFVINASSQIILHGTAQTIWWNPQMHRKAVMIVVIMVTPKMLFVK